MNHSIFEIQAEFCKAMGHATRLHILHVLSEHPMKVGEIVRVTGCHQSLVSRQLNILRDAGVVFYKRQGNESIYQLTDENIAEVCNLVRRVLSNQIRRQSEAVSITDI